MQNVEYGLSKSETATAKVYQQTTQSGPKKNDWGKMRTAEVVVTARGRLVKERRSRASELEKEGTTGHEE
jgi:hypothetical protein